MYCMIRLYVLMFCIWPADLFPTKYSGIIFFFFNGDCSNEVE